MALSYKVELRTLQLKACDIFWQAFDASFDDAVRKAEEPFQQLMTAAALANEKVRPNAKELLTMQAFEENLKLFTNSVNSAGYVIPNHFIDHYFGYFCSESSKLTGLPQEIGWIFVRSKYAQKGNLLEFSETDYIIDCRTWFYNTFQLAALKVLDNPTLFDKSGPKMETMRNIEEAKRRVIEPSIFDGICMSLDWTRILQIPMGLISLPRSHPSYAHFQQPTAPASARPPQQQQHQAAYPSRAVPSQPPQQAYPQPSAPLYQQPQQQPPVPLYHPPQQSPTALHHQPQQQQPSVPLYQPQQQQQPSVSLYSQPQQPVPLYQTQQQHTGSTTTSDTTSGGVSDSGSSNGISSSAMKQEMEQMKNELLRANEEKMAGIQRQFGTELENVKREMAAKQQANNTLNERLDESSRKIKQFQEYYVQQAEEARRQHQQQVVRIQPTIIPTPAPITSSFSTSYYPPPQQQQQLQLPSSAQNLPSLSSSSAPLGSYNSVPRLSAPSSSLSIPIMPPTPKANAAATVSSNSGISKPFNFDEHGLLDQHFTNSRPVQQSQQSQPVQVSLLTSTVPLPTPAPFHPSHVEYANDEYGALRGQQAYESEHEEVTRPPQSSSSSSSSSVQPKEPEKN